MSNKQRSIVSSVVGYNIGDVVVIIGRPRYIAESWSKGYIGVVLHVNPITGSVDVEHDLKDTGFTTTRYYKPCNLIKIGEL